MQINMSYQWTSISVLFLTWSVYHVFRALYSIFLGPLSKIPGPKIAAATRAIRIYRTLTGTQEAWHHRLHQRYGDIVRTSPTDVSFATGKAWKEVYGNAPGSRYPKHQHDPVFYSQPEDQGMLVMDAINHDRHRKIFSHAFSEKALKQQEPLLRKYTGQLITNLHRVASTKEEIDIVKYYNFTTFDIMGEFAWGESLGCLQTSSYIPWITMIYASVKVASFIPEIQRYPYLFKLLIALMPASLKAKRAQHAQFTADRVDARIARQSENPRPDLWGFVLEAKEDQKLSLAEMHSNGQLFMVAGTETTATIMSGLTYYLLLNPEMMEKITNEVRNAYTSSDQIDIPSLYKLPYFNACLQEGLRIYPAIPFGLPRVVREGGTNFGGYYIPEKTSIYVHQYSTYHNANNFYRPKEFLPQRWLSESTTNPQSIFSNDDRSALQPFLVGPRNCIGMNLANMEMRLILASVLFDFDLHLCERSRGWENQKVFILWEKGPLVVTVTPAGSDRDTAAATTAVAAKV